MSPATMANSTSLSLKRRNRGPPCHPPIAEFICRCLCASVATATTGQIRRASDHDESGQTEIHFRRRANRIRRPEQIVEHVRMRISHQICGSLLDQGFLKVLRLGNRWDMVFHQSLKRDAKGEVAEFDIDPRLMEEFAGQASTAIRKRLDEKHLFVMVTTAETRPFVRMIIERMFPTLPVLSQLEIARGIEVKSLGVVA